MSTADKRSQISPDSAHNTWAAIEMFRIKFTAYVKKYFVRRDQSIGEYDPHVHQLTVKSHSSDTLFPVISNVFASIWIIHLTECFLYVWMLWFSLTVILSQDGWALVLSVSVALKPQHKKLSWTFFLMSFEAIFQPSSANCCCWSGLTAKHDAAIENWIKNNKNKMIMYCAHIKCHQSRKIWQSVDRVLQIEKWIWAKRIRRTVWLGGVWWHRPGQSAQWWWGKCRSQRFRQRLASARAPIPTVHRGQLLSAKCRLSASQAKSMGLDSQSEWCACVQCAHVTDKRTDTKF